jgi:hypothetical protein
MTAADITRNTLKQILFFLVAVSEPKRQDRSTQVQQTRKATTSIAFLSRLLLDQLLGGHDIGRLKIHSLRRPRISLSLMESMEIFCRNRIESSSVCVVTVVHFRLFSPRRFGSFADLVECVESAQKEIGDSFCNRTNRINRSPSPRS